MSYSNRELVTYYISYKLSQRNYCSHIEFPEDRSRTEGLEQTEVNGEGALASAHANGSVNGGSQGLEQPPLLPSSSPSPQSLEAVKEALRDSANEFELRYNRAFTDLSSQLHITPATAYQSFESVMNEVFRDDVNWGRIVGLFAFGGALCVECVEKEMSHLVGRIADWMTVYLDNNIQPWIEGQGGWVSDGHGL
ncbi:bcl-2-like protein 1-like, partial [Arapaima gigas]